MNFATHTSALVFTEKSMACRKPKLPRAMATTQSAVARLENVCLQEQTSPYLLSNGMEAIGLSIELTLKPVKQRYGIFPTAEAVNCGRCPYIGMRRPNGSC